MDYYATIATDQTRSKLARGAANVGLALSSLWTSETWVQTSAVLAGAGLASAGVRIAGVRAGSAATEGIGLAERKLLRDFFGQGLKGAQQRAKDFSLPEGLTRETLLDYAKVAERQIGRGADKTGVQAERLKLIQRALDEMK